MEASDKVTALKNAQRQRISAALAALAKDWPQADREKLAAHLEAMGERRRYNNNRAP